MSRFTVIECEQRTPEWHAARAGRVTASRAADMLAKIKSGESAGRRNYRTQLVAERLTGQPQENGYVNAAMQHGIDTEPHAIAAYEALTGALVRKTGFLAMSEYAARRARGTLRRRSESKPMAMVPTTPPISNEVEK